MNLQSFQKMNRPTFKSCKICFSVVSKINEKYNLVICSSCKLIFCETIYSQEDFENTYSSLYRNSDGYNHYQKKFENLKSGKKVPIGRTKLTALKFLLKKENLNILELGAGIGVVADFLQRKKHNYYGLEMNLEIVENARNIGLNVHQGDFTVLESLDITYDTILAFEVIEHLQDIGKLFSIVYDKLEPGGYFIFTVPNYHKRKNYIKPKNKIYQSGPPVHLNFFTMESLTNIAKYYDFEITELTSKKFPYLNWKKWDTYKFMFRSFFNRYHGPTLIGILKKQASL